MTKHEKYQLDWMLTHGYSLKDLITALEKVQHKDPEDTAAISRPISEIFEEWEKKVGFGEDNHIWLRQEVFDNPTIKTTYGTFDLKQIPRKMLDAGGYTVDHASEDGRYLVVKRPTDDYVFAVLADEYNNKEEH